MRNYITKGLISVSTVLVALLASKAAFAKDCREPDAFVSGIQDLAQPNIGGSSAVVRDGATLRVRFYCNDGKAGNVSTTSGLGKQPVVAADVQKKGSVEIRVSNEYVEFIGVVNGNVGDKKDFTFSDGGGGSYTVNVTFADKVATQGGLDALGAKKANVGDSHTKGEAENIFEHKGTGYNKDEADKRFMPIGSGFGNDGRSRLQLMPSMIIRTDGADLAGGISGLFGYHVPDPSVSGFEFAVAALYARGRLDNRAVQGVPLTEPNVYEDIARLKALACYDIVAGGRVNIPLCGGLFIQWLHVPDTSIGQDPINGTVWGNHARNDIQGGALLSLGVNVVLTGDQHRGLFLGIGADPIFPFAKTYKVNGGETRYVVSFDTHLALGLRL